MIISEQIKRDLEEKGHLLNRIERDYLDAMLARKGVLYITSAPGMAKSSIIKAIAKKLDWKFIEQRLSSKDESDIGTFPHIQYLLQNEKNEIVEVAPYTDGSTAALNFIPPKWAIVANTRPTIVFFDELNRAQLPVRNAALQLLLERTIGEDFEFNENVLMCAAGNLGDEDGTDVEEFDAALNNRLIHKKHILNDKQWIEFFAKDNILPEIVEFIEAQPTYYYYKDSSNGEIPKEYATPRSWEMLSERYFVHTGNKDKIINGEEGYAIDKLNFVSFLKDWGHCYVGVTASRKIYEYIESHLKISLDDILNKYTKIKKDVNRMSRSQWSEYAEQLKKRDISLFDEKQVNNCIEFLKLLDGDQTKSVLYDCIIDIEDDKMLQEPTSRFFHAFPEYLKKMKMYNRNK